MKGTDIKSGIVWTALGALLFFSVVPSWGEEVNFLKTRFMNAQERLGGALSESARLNWGAGKIEENIGSLIRDAGPQGKVDQGLLGREIARSAQLKWNEERAQEALGSAVLKSARIVSQEREIKGAVQEQMGSVILSLAQLQWIDPKTLEITAQRKAGLEQEALGSKILDRARFGWAETAFARSVQRALRTTGPETAAIPQDALSVLRNASGRTYEATLLEATTLMDKKPGAALERIVPAPTEVVQASVPLAAPKRGWGGFGEFGLPALLGFFWAIGAFFWFQTGLERPFREDPRMDKQWKTARSEGFNKAA